MKAGRQPRRFVAHTPYNSPYPDPIKFRPGEQVLTSGIYTGNPDWKDWIRCRGESGAEAWVPLQFLTVSGESAVFLREFNARELTVIPGDILLVHEIVNGFAWGVKSDGDSGWVSLNCISEAGPGE